VASAWIFQKPEDVEKLGADKAPHYVGWYEPDGTRRKKSCGPGLHGKRNADKLRRKLEAELTTGTYQMHTKKLWADFRQEYETRILAGKAPKTQAQAKTSLDHFERLVNAQRVVAINTQHLDDFIAKRRQEPGLKPGSVISPASVNADLRNLKAAFRVAREWGYLKEVPKIRMEKVPKKLPTYVTGDHFAAIYRACDQARMPENLPYPAADWWHALLVMGYMTGWRISDMLGLRRQDVDLGLGTAITRYEENKGKRDERVDLHRVVVDHLRKIPGLDPRIFPWNHNERTLYSEFARIQEKAEIKLPCKARGEHQHTRYCYVYGFHDLRRAFATMNADKLTADALQALMRHKSYQTTQVYISMSRQMKEAVASLHVPEVLKVGG
jgi:integrase